jgi:hypothetical protein
MTDLPPNALLRLHLIDPASPDGIAVDAFARVLTACQKLVFGLVRLAMPALRVNSEFRRRYELRGVPQGDGAIAMAFGPRQLAFDLQLGTSPQEVRQQLATWLVAIDGHDAEALSALCPEPATRKRLLREVAKLLPRPGEPWSLEVAVPHGPALTLGATAARWLDARLAELSPSGPIMMTVTGELVGVDFERATFSLRYAPTGRILDGGYAADEEVALLKSRRKLVHVTGEFVLDEDDHPIRLKRSVRVAVADLSPVVVSEVVTEHGQAFALVPALSLVPVMDAESQQLYEVADESLDLLVTAPTREQLEREVMAAVAAQAAAPSRPWKRLFKPLVAAGD